MEYGYGMIEISDNGGGICEENFESLALRHHTSKLETIEDLNDISSFGFRFC